MSSYNLGNEGARLLTEENAETEEVPVLQENNQELIKPDSAFYVNAIEMFDQIPFNVDVTEKRLLVIHPLEKEDSDIFTFENSISGGGVIKLDESKMRATMSVKYNNNDINADTWVDCMPHPLHTMWKAAEVFVNGVTITNSNNGNLFVSDILSRLYSHNERNSDLAGCSLGYRNPPGEQGYLSKITDAATNTAAKTSNPGAVKRVAALKREESLIDYLSFCFFGMGPQYIPLNNIITVKLTKDTSRRFFTGSEWEYAGNDDATDSDFHIANAHTAAHAAHTAHYTNGGQSATNLANLDRLKTKLKQFEIEYGVYTPSAQIQSDITRMLDVEGKYMNVFYQEIHVRSEVHSLSNSKFSCHNVFGSNAPYVLILTVVRTDYENGDFFRTPSHCTWEKIKEVVVKVNNVPLPVKIESLKDAYFQTRKSLHLGDSEKMYVDYDNYEDGDCIMVFELSPSEDSNLKVLPKEMKKSVSVEITFDTMANVDVYIKMTGLFNQVCKVAGMQTTFKQLAI